LVIIEIWRGNDVSKIYKQTVLERHVTYNKKLSCRRETARRFMSLDILLSHPRSVKAIRNDTVE